MVCPMWTVSYGMYNVDYKLWSVQCGLLAMVCTMWTVSYGMYGVDC